MSRVLLVNPPSSIDVYSNSKIRVAITSAPFVTLGALAGAVLEDNHDVRVADLKYYSMFHRKFYFRPSYILKRFWRDIHIWNLWDDVKAVLSDNWGD